MDKSEQRRIARQRRAELTPHERQTASEAICERLKSIPAVAGAETVFSYLAMLNEVDLSAFHTWAQAHGITVAFPVTSPDGTMEAYAPTAQTLWVRGGFGIREPAPKTARLVAPEDIDLILTPCVAFDEDCRRLGQGGGFYDRYFARCPGAIRLAAAFEVQRLPAVTCDSHDTPLHAVLTEKRLYGMI